MWKKYKFPVLQSLHRLFQNPTVRMSSMIKCPHIAAADATSFALDALSPRIPQSIFGS